MNIQNLKVFQSFFKRIFPNKVVISADDLSEKSKIKFKLKILSHMNTEINVIEFKKIFTEDEIIKWGKSMDSTQLTLRYFLSSYYSGHNVEMTYSVKEYKEILNKINDFLKYADSYDLDIYDLLLFISSQLSEYIKYSESIDYKWSKEESSLYSAIKNGKGVCISYAMALKQFCDILNVPCEILLGKNNQVGHAWNQLEVNGIWYTFDLNAFSDKHDSKYLFMDTEEFEKK